MTARRSATRHHGRAAVRKPPTGAKGLDAVFRPRSVAVIGASRRSQSIGHEILRNLVACGFNGPVFPLRTH